MAPVRLPFRVTRARFWRGPSAHGAPVHPRRRFGRIRARTYAEEAEDPPPEWKARLEQTTPFVANSGPSRMSG